MPAFITEILFFGKSYRMIVPGLRSVSCQPSCLNSFKKLQYFFEWRMTYLNDVSLGRLNEVKLVKRIQKKKNWWNIVCRWQRYLLIYFTMHMAAGVSSEVIVEGWIPLVLFPFYIRKYTHSACSEVSPSPSKSRTFYMNVWV